MSWVWFPTPRLLRAIVSYRGLSQAITGYHRLSQVIMSYAYNPPMGPLIVVDYWGLSCPCHSKNKHVFQIATSSSVEKRILTMFWEIYIKKYHFPKVWCVSGVWLLWVFVYTWCVCGVCIVCVRHACVVCPWNVHGMYMVSEWCVSSVWIVCIWCATGMWLMCET